MFCAMEKKEISHFAAAPNNEIKKAPRAKLNCSWEYMFADGTRPYFIAAVHCGNNNFLN